MNPDMLRDLLRELRAGDTTVDAVLERLSLLPFESIDGATIDHHRALRLGFPEVIFCAGKTPAQVVEIAERLVASGQNVLGTRVTAEQAAALDQHFGAAELDRLARTVVIRTAPPKALPGTVAVVCAGTSDLPVAREALVTAGALGIAAELIEDVGVAGLHRTLAAAGRLSEATVAVVVAGMEGALPSVVGGLTAAPVIAVPTSVGYGVALGGIAALCGMLTSCAAGVTVVNIDNGFGAAYAAARILQRLARAPAE